MTDRTELERQIAADEAALAEKRAQLAALPEVDPLLVEAREICATIWREENRPNFEAFYRNGVHPENRYMRTALAALRRGMELAPRAVMDDAAVEALVALRYASAVFQDYAALHTAKGTREGRGKAQTNLLHKDRVDAAIATLSRVPAAAWLGEDHLRFARETLENIAHNNWLDPSRAKLVAREALAHMTGGAA
jgi:hypothetical protein